MKNEETIIGLNPIISVPKVMDVFNKTKRNNERERWEI